jgi:hypothetical protein
MPVPLPLLTRSQLLEYNAGLRQALDPQAKLNISSLSDVARREREIRARMAVELVSADARFGTWFLWSWKQFMESMADARDRDPRVKDLNEYLVNRVVDTGAVSV